MSYPNPSTALAAVIVDELVRAGATLLVASPGSRSTAVLLAADDRSELEVVMAVDERSAGFHALGWAKASGRLAVVLTTSGTAVANLMPAVVEADASRTPMVILSGDRPPELRGVGANQTIDQQNFFGHFVRAAVELGPGERQAEAPRWWRSTMASVLGSAFGFGAVPGPVQINLSIREPTVQSSDDGRTATSPYPFDHQGRPSTASWTETMAGRSPSSDQLATLAKMIDGADRGVVVAGNGVGPAASLTELAEKLRWPVVASFESGLRGEAGVLSTGHHLVGVQDLRPDLILRFGSPGPSRRILEFVSGSVRQVVVGSAWSDPGRNAAVMVDASIPAVIEGLIDVVAPGPDEAWIDWWHEADALVRRTLTPELSGAVTEPAIAATVAQAGADVLVVGSSMPIRDLEMFGWASLHVVANRGASGIDGLVSTALGASWEAARPLALVGDLSFLHDSNGFLCEPRPDCVFVVIDNSGGGIFSFLPQATHVGDRFDRLFMTPHGRDLERLAEFHQLGVTTVADTDSLDEAIDHGWKEGGGRMIIARTDSVSNVDEHRRLDGLAQDALREIPPPR